MRPHISIDVKNVTATVEFYKKIFGVNPSKFNENYAKFDLKNPNLNFTMQTAKGECSKVSHFGVELESVEEVVDWQKKLESAGLIKAVETGTNCCYAVQDKVWVQDPDGNAWEFFFVHQQLPVEGELNKSSNSACCTPSFGKAKTSCC